MLRSSSLIRSSPLYMFTRLVIPAIALSGWERLNAAGSGFGGGDGGGGASFLEVGEDGSFANAVTGSSIDGVGDGGGGAGDASFLEVGWLLAVVERLFLLPFFVMDRWRRRRKRDQDSRLLKEMVVNQQVG